MTWDCNGLDGKSKDNQPTRKVVGYDSSVSYQKVSLKVRENALAQ